MYVWNATPFSAFSLCETDRRTAQKFQNLIEIALCFKNTHISSLFWLTSQSVGIDRMRTHTNKVYFAIDWVVKLQRSGQHNFGHFFHFKRTASREIRYMYWVWKLAKISDFRLFFLAQNWLKWTFYYAIGIWR